MNNLKPKHIPVMLQEVLDNLLPANGAVYVDATFGNGGYTQAILNAADCKVIAIDRDPNVVKKADELKNIYGDRFEFRNGQFGDFAQLITEDINGAVFDIGVSSMQLDQGERGFSFSKEAPLDMRMSCQGQTAADLVNSLSEKELADILYNFGEERKSRQIAAKIVAVRKTAPIMTTTQLADIVCSVVHPTHQAIHPATRTFQALRIAVNNELGELQNGLEGALSRLKSGGKLVVVDFHSLEDRIVKNFFNNKLGKTHGVSRYAPLVDSNITPALASASKAIAPSAEETESNPRARSAKLRVAVKL